MWKETCLFVVFLLIIVVKSIDSVGVPISTKKDMLNEKSQVKPSKDDESPVVIEHLQKANNQLLSNNSSAKNVSVGANKNATIPSVEHSGQPGESKIDETLEENSNEPGPGAISRAVLVLVSISIIFFLYVGFKTCRRKRLDKSKIMIRKYGVRTNRSDVEMEPLPLSEDEDDETVFDLTASRISNR